MGKLDGKKVAILVADGFEQVEMTKPREALEEAGAETKIVSPKSGQIQGMNPANKGDKFDVDIPLDEARPGYRGNLERVRKAAGLTRLPNKRVAHYFSAYRLPGISASAPPS